MRPRRDECQLELRETENDENAIGDCSVKLRTHLVPSCLWFL